MRAFVWIDAHIVNTNPFETRNEKQHHKKTHIKQNDENDGSDALFIVDIYIYIFILFSRSMTI